MLIILSFVSVPLRRLGRWKVDLPNNSVRVFIVSVPLRGLGQAGIRSVESAIASGDLNAINKVSVPLRGLGRWKAAIAAAITDYQISVFQSPCGD